jgi:hypothetical protein
VDAWVGDSAGEIGSPGALTTLRAASAAEREPFVQEEVEAAFDRLRAKLE